MDANPSSTRSEHREWTPTTTCEHGTCTRTATMWVTSKGQYWCIRCINGRCHHDEENR